jgi:hypothetical protein
MTKVLGVGQNNSEKKFVKNCCFFNDFVKMHSEWPSLTINVPE